MQTLPLEAKTLHCPKRTIYVGVESEQNTSAGNGTANETVYSYYMGYHHGN